MALFSLLFLFAALPLAVLFVGMLGYLAAAVLTAVCVKWIAPAVRGLHHKK